MGRDMKLPCKITASLMQGDTGLSRRPPVAIVVHQTTGSVRLTSQVGDVSADQMNGGTVSTETSTGNIQLSFSAAPDQAQATSNTGRIEAETRST